MLGAWAWNIFHNRKNEERSTRANTAVQDRRLRDGAHRELRAHDAALVAGRAPPDRGRRGRQPRGAGPRERAAFPRRHAAAPRRVDGGRVARVRGFVADDHRLGRHDVLAGRRLRPREARHQARGRGRARAQAGPHRGREGRAEEVRHARAAAHRGAEAGGREERARREGTAGSAVRVGEGGRAAAAQPAGRSAAARAGLFARSARSAVAPRRSEAQGLRHRSRSRRRAAGPGRHALRAAARGGREGERHHHRSRKTWRVRCRC